MPLDNPPVMFVFIVGGVFAVGFLPMFLWSAYDVIQSFRHPERPYYSRWHIPPPPERRRLPSAPSNPRLAQVGIPMAKPRPETHQRI